MRNSSSNRRVAVNSLESQIQFGNFWHCGNVDADGPCGLVPRSEQRRSLILGIAVGIERQPMPHSRHTVSKIHLRMAIAIIVRGSCLAAPFWESGLKKFLDRERIGRAPCQRGEPKPDLQVPGRFEADLLAINEWLRAELLRKVPCYLVTDQYEMLSGDLPEEKVGADRPENSKHAR